VPRLTAIVPATNSPPTLAACLEAIRNADDPPEELIVATEGVGPAAARNDGARRASGDIVVFVDADVLPHHDAFARVRRAFDLNPELVALFGSYDNTPTAPGVVSAFRNLLHHHVHQEGAGPTGTFWAGLGAIRRDSFLDAGGFDADRYSVPSIEDIELGTRLAADRALIVLDPHLLGTHLKHWSLWNMVWTDFTRRGIPWVDLMLRRRHVSSTLNLGLRHRLSALASMAAVLALVRRRLRLATGATLILVALNARFYMLLARRRGPRMAVIGIGLHALHHLVAVAAVPAGIVAHLLNRRSGRPR
jgi:glycosyltransferase involved in cell wall biosynthesis